MLGRFSAMIMAGSMLALTSQAHAQSISADEAAQLRSELAALKAQVIALEARLAPPSPPPAVAAPPKPATEINWRGAPEFKQKDGWSFKPRGRIQLDAGYVNGPDGLTIVGDGFASRVRRVRLGFEGNIPGGFGYKVEADFTSGNAEFADAFLTYTDGGTVVTIGQQDNLQGLERISTSNVESFLERASFNEAFNFERKVGISIAQEAGPFLLQAGIFTDSISDLNLNGNSSIGVDGRIIYAPKLGKVQVHLAASGHWRDIPLVQPVTRYRSRPQIRTTDIRFVSTPNLSVDAESDFGLEAAVISGRFHAATEAHWLKASLPGSTDPTLFGASVEAGLFLTDDTRGYGKGVFRAIKVKRPVGQGGIGAWQINARYDHLDLNDGAVVGGSQDAYMVSLVWTPIDYVRFMLNYARLDLRRAAISVAGDRDYGVDTLGMRAQVSF